MCLSLLNDKYLVSSSTLIGPLEPSHAPLARGRSQAHLESRIGEIKAKFLVLYESFDRRITRTDGCGVKIIGLYGTVGFIAIRDFSF